MTLRRVLITGGAGFIGSHVAARFAAEGLDVHVIDDLSDGHRSNVERGITLHVCDAEGSAARRVVRQLRPDAVLHFAADAAAARDRGVRRHRDDVATSRRLFAVAGRYAPGARIVFASTVGIFAADDQHPLSGYAGGKLAAEDSLRAMASGLDLDHVILRLANVYGPRQNGSSASAVIPSFCRALVRRQPLRIFGDGAQTRDFIHVRDVADAVWLAATLPPPKDRSPLAVATGRSISVLNVARLLASLSGGGDQVEFAAPQCGEPRHSRPDPTTTRAHLGWQARIPLEEGLASTLEWYRASARPPLFPQLLAESIGTADGARAP